MEETINMVTAEVLVDVSLEREKQDNKWGEQNHDPYLWLAILGEEVGEANQAALKAQGDGHSKTWDKEKLRHLREELVQVAAVAGYELP